MPIRQELKQDPASTTEQNKPPPPPFVSDLSNSQESSSSASNSQEQPNFGEQFARDARLQFLRQILQRIKQNAEQMVSFYKELFGKGRKLALKKCTLLLQDSFYWVLLPVPTQHSSLSRASTAPCKSL